MGKFFAEITLESTANVVSNIESKELSIKKRDTIAKAQQEYPSLYPAKHADNGLNMYHKSNFYKFPIAFMSHAFADQGIIDFSYVDVDMKHYGVDIYDYFKGNYQFVPSTVHNADVMARIKHMLKMERKIPPILYRSEVRVPPALHEGHFVSLNTIKGFSKEINKRENVAEYKVQDKIIQEVYFGPWPSAPPKI